MRHDKCRCGATLTWDPVEMNSLDRVECLKCGTVYKMDCDSVLVYWLKEVIDERIPYETEPR